MMKTTAQLQSPRTCRDLVQVILITAGVMMTGTSAPVVSIQFSNIQITLNTEGISECRIAGDTSTDLDLPICGSLLSPTLRYGLSELQLVAGELSPDFNVVVPIYRGTA